MLKIYDAKDDTFREATQEDVDVLQAGVNAYAQLRGVLFHPDGTPKFLTGDEIELARAIHQRFRDHVKRIREKKSET